MCGYDWSISVGGKGRVGRVCLPVEHLFEEVELCQCHSQDGNQFEHCEVLYLVLMGSDNLGVNGLTLFLKLLILGNFLQFFAHINQPCMQFVDLTLLGQLQQMRPVVRVEVHRYRFLSPIGSRETHSRAFPANLCLVCCPSQLDDSTEGTIHGRSDDDMGG